LPIADEERITHSHRLHLAEEEMAIEGKEARAVKLPRHAAATVEQNLLRGQARRRAALPPSFEKCGDARAEREEAVRVRRIGAIDQLLRVAEQPGRPALTA